MVKPLLRRFGDLVVFLYFITHIPITILIDSQVLLRKSITYHPAISSVFDDYSVNFQDKLVTNAPLWFQVFTLCELILQLPFFPVAAYAYYKGKNWIRIPAIVYGVHVVTTLIPILSTQFFDPEYRPTSNIVLLGLSAIYSIYFFIPFYIVVTNVLYEKPFGDELVKKKKQ
ncbi:sigma intracellular receptor [Acrasis kona]|uniref:Sigma intracellular receptor n=1 Tax=Acrasis kona TaxID=1008807 RepID=A0AAW2YR08_9EUKA